MGASKQRKKGEGGKKERLLFYGHLSILILKVGSQPQGCKVKVAEE